MLKILSGQFKSRRLKTPRDNETTRPWTGRARESVFNQLRGHINEGIVLDLFAGVGTMGLEAASRGAKEVVLVEQDRKIFAMLENNIATLDCKDTAIALQPANEYLNKFEHSIQSLTQKGSSYYAHH
jgi:16S rRNA (guanine966-N2)-methyltransferase